MTWHDPYLFGAACLSFVGAGCAGAPASEGTGYGVGERLGTAVQPETSGLRHLYRPVRQPGHSIETPPGCPNLSYYGGRVVSNVVVVQVYWTSAVASGAQSYLPGFYTAITDSAYLDLMGEYSTVGLNGYVDQLPGSNQTIGRGTFAGAVTITPGTNSHTIQDSDIQTELAAQITAGNLPAPALDSGGNVNTIYMFDFPPGYTIYLDAQDPSCTTFCAYHNTAVINGMSVAYGVIPDLSPTGPCGSGCGSGTYADVLGVNHSHELAESITDTEVGIGGNALTRPVAWYSDGQNCGEIADLCDSDPMNGGAGGYTVEKLWSNLQNTCADGPGPEGGAPDGGSNDGGLADAGEDAEFDAPTDAVEASAADSSMPFDQDSSAAGDANGNPRGVQDTAITTTTSGCGCRVAEAPPATTLRLAGIVAIVAGVGARRRGRRAGRRQVGAAR